MIIPVVGPVFIDCGHESAGEFHFWLDDLVCTLLLLVYHKIKFPPFHVQSQFLAVYQLDSELTDTHYCSPWKSVKFLIFHFYSSGHEPTWKDQMSFWIRGNPLPRLAATVHKWTTLSLSSLSLLNIYIKCATRTHAQFTGFETQRNSKCILQRFTHNLLFQRTTNHSRKPRR